MANLKSYRACFVPLCTNTTKTIPRKMLLNVPQDVKRRNQWFQAVRRKNPKTSSNYFCCEDHFDIPDDVENYIRLKLMGEGKVRMKKGVVPHKNLPGPISLREELNARQTVLQNQKKGIKQTNVEHSETVDGCPTVKKLKRSTSVEKQNSEEFMKQMNVKRLKKLSDVSKQKQTSDCFVEKEEKVRIPRNNLNKSQPVISDCKTVCLQSNTEINRPVVALNSVQNISDNKVILEILDPNNVLSNLHGLTNEYSAVIEQVFDKNDVKTHIVLCKKDSVQICNKSKLQEIDNNEIVLPDVEQKNMDVDSETDSCDVKIKMEESVTDTMNIKFEPEEFIPYIKQEQVDARPFERSDGVNEKEMKNNESRETDAVQIKVEAKEDCDRPCLSYVKQEFTECL